MLIELAELLEQEIKDELLIFPTDTVYGIGALVSSSKGIEKIYHLKGRDHTKPLAVLVANLEQAKSLVEASDEDLIKASKFWPGAFTFIFKKSNLVSDYISSNPYVGIRIPDSKEALAILEKFGPMATTSVNISGEVSLNTLEEVKDFGADYVLNASCTNSGVSSTVFDVTTKKVLRQGKDYEKVLLTFGVQDE